MKEIYMKNKFFLKYLASYLIVLLIPLVLFTAFINHSLLNVMRKQFEEETLQGLYQFETEMDNSLSRIEAVRDNLISMGNLNVPLELEDVLAAQELISTLETYTISNSVIADIAYYCQGDSYIYTSHSSYRLERFLAEVYYSGNWNTDEFIQMIPKLEARMVRAEEWMNLEGQNEKIITVLYPVESRNGKGVLLFMLHMENMVTRNGNDAFFVRDSEGNVLLSSYPEDFEVEKWRELDWNTVLEMQESPFVYQESLVSATRSEFIDLEYLKVCPISEIDDAMEASQRKFFIVEIVIVLVGAVLIWMMMKVNYSPLRHLGEYLQKLGRGHSQSVSEIKNAVEDFANENEALRVQYVGASRNQFLHLLLKGKIADFEFFDSQVKKLEMKMLQGKYFYVLAVIVRPENAAAVSIAEVESVLGKRLQGYLREEGEKGKYIFVGTVEQENQSYLNRMVMEVHEVLCERLAMDVVIAVSGLQEGYENIPQCYMDAMLAADYRFIKGYRCVIDSTMVVLNGEIGTVYPQKMFDSLNYQIKCGDADKIEQSLNQITDYIKSSQLPLFYVKGLCYQLINNISAIIEQMNREFPQMKRTRLSYAAILADFETVDDLVETVQNISMNICDFIRNRKQEENSRLMVQIHEYLDREIYSPNFAIQTMATELQISLSSLSTFFKNQGGETLSDYVTRRRMQEVIRLMMEEESTIGDAVLQVGYLNVSSFIRKFKNIYGLTPGQYIKEYKGKDKEDDIFV